MTPVEKVQLIASIGTLAAVIVAVIELFSFSSYSKRQRAYEMVDRFWSNCFDAMATMRSVGGGLPINFSHNPMFARVSNYFEGLADMWTSNQINRGIIERNLGQYIRDAFSVHQSDIERIRESENRDFCKKWEQMLYEVNNPRPLNIHDLLKRQQTKKGWF